MADEKAEKHGFLRKMGIGKDDAGMEVKDPNPEIVQDSPWQKTVKEETDKSAIPSDPFAKGLDQHMDPTETVGAADTVRDAETSDPKGPENKAKDGNHGKKGLFSSLFVGGAKAMESAPTSETFGDSTHVPTSNVESVDAIAGPKKGADAEKAVQAAVYEGADVKTPGIATRVKEEAAAVGDALKGLMRGNKK